MPTLSSISVLLSFMEATLYGSPVVVVVSVTVVVVVVVTDVVVVDVTDG